MPTIIKANQAIEATSFRLHYFPDIPFDCACAEENATAEASRFEQVDFSVLDSGCSMVGDLQRDNDAHEGKIRLHDEQGAQAYESGYQKGCAEGYQAGLQQAATDLANLGRIAMELEQLKKALYQRAEKDVVDLSLAVAAKILDQEIKTNREAVLAVVKAALKRVTDHSQITIRVNPADLQTVRQAEPSLAAYLENSSAVSYVEDAAIGAGGCIIETKFGDIDARLDQQFQAIAQALQTDPAPGDET